MSEDTWAMDDSSSQAAFFTSGDYPVWYCNSYDTPSDLITEGSQEPPLSAITPYTTGTTGYQSSYGNMSVSKPGLDVPHVKDSSYLRYSYQQPDHSFRASASQPGALSGSSFFNMHNIAVPQARATSGALVSESAAKLASC